jgi:hypothetical protein
MFGCDAVSPWVSLQTQTSPSDWMSISGLRRFGSDVVSNIDSECIRRSIYVRPSIQAGICSCLIPCVGKVLPRRERALSQSKPSNGLITNSWGRGARAKQTRSCPARRLLMAEVG